MSHPTRRGAEQGEHEGVEDQPRVDADAGHADVVLDGEPVETLGEGGVDHEGEGRLLGRHQHVGAAADGELDVGGDVAQPGGGGDHHHVGAAAQGVVALLASERATNLEARVHGEQPGHRRAELAGPVDGDARRAQASGQASDDRSRAGIVMRRRLGRACAGGVDDGLMGGRGGALAVETFVGLTSPT